MFLDCPSATNARLGELSLALGGITAIVPGPCVWFAADFTIGFHGVTTMLVATRVHAKTPATVSDTNVVVCDHQ